MRCHGQADTRNRPKFPRYPFRMPRPEKLDPAAVDTWLATHAGWTQEGDALARSYTLPDFATAVAFAVRIGMIAEKRDHHPDLHIGWGKAKAIWSTHDAGGITQLDLDLAEATDGVAST